MDHMCKWGASRNPWEGYQIRLAPTFPWLPKREESKTPPLNFLPNGWRLEACQSPVPESGSGRISEIRQKSGLIWFCVKIRPCYNFFVTIQLLPWLTHRLHFLLSAYRINWYLSWDWGDESGSRQLNLPLPAGCHHSSQWNNELNGLSVDAGTAM